MTDQAKPRFVRVPLGCKCRRWLTPGKVYEVIGTAPNGYSWIIDDGGDHCIIRLTESRSLDGASWEIADSLDDIRRTPEQALQDAAPALLTALHQYRSDLLHPPAPDSVERRLQMIDALIAQAGGAQ